LYIDKEVSFADLKQTLFVFYKEMFGKSKNLFVRLIFLLQSLVLRSIFMGLKTETDYRITKGTGWLEIGCGMVDPNVLEKLWHQS
jgi:phenylalanyl-tRNA synthetase alpha chain